MFRDKGYADAGIAEIVERSGVSVGSIYHHFGGKAEVFIALWQQQQSESLGAAGHAVAAARAEGMTDPIALFLEGARAYLESVFARREVSISFVVGDGPAGFEAMRRGNWQKWIQQNTVLLSAGDDLVSRFQVSMVTSLLGDGARELTSLDDQSEGETVIALILDYVARILMA